MSLESVVAWIICGLVVGLCARFLVPSPRNHGINGF